jgi:hypothetical protein
MSKLFNNDNKDILKNQADEELVENFDFQPIKAQI